MSSPAPPFTSAWASIPLYWCALQQISDCLPAPALMEIPRIRKEAEHHYRVSSSFCSTKYSGMKKGWRANSPGNTPLIEEWFLLLQQLNKSQRLQVVCVSGIAPIDQKEREMYYSMNSCTCQANIFSSDKAESQFKTNPCLCSLHTVHLVQF